MEIEPFKINPKTFLRDHCALQPLPEFITKIQRAVNSDNITIDVDHIAQQISRDSALVAQILKIVNSAYYTLPRKVSNIRFAVAFLGIAEISKIAFSFSVVNSLDIKDHSILKKFWSHSYLTALWAKEVDKNVRSFVGTEELWTAAILHDIGKLVYLKFFPDHCKALIQYCNENGSLFCEAEDILKFPKSSDMGALLCDRWGLETIIQSACETHTVYDLQKIDASQSDADLKRVICLGNIMAILTQDDINAQTREKIYQTARSELKLSEDDFLLFLGKNTEFSLEVDALSAHI